MYLIMILKVMLYTIVTIYLQLIVMLFKLFYPPFLSAAQSTFINRLKRVNPASYLSWI